MTKQITKTLEVWPPVDREKAPISLFPNARIKNGELCQEVVTLSQLLSSLKGDHFTSVTDDYLERISIEGKSILAKKWRAANMPVFVVGDCPERGNLRTYVPLIVVDVDRVDQSILGFYLTQCEKISYVYAAFASPSRQGLRVLVWAVSTPESHKVAYRAVCRALGKDLSLPLKTDGAKEDEAHIDDATTDALLHVWFAAHVPANLFYQNPESSIFSAHVTLEQLRQWKEDSISGGERQQGGGYTYFRPAQENLPAQEAQKTSYAVDFSTDTAAKVEAFVREVERRQLDATQGKTGNWFRIGCALVAQFGELGREYFHRVSKFHPGYDLGETNKQFDECLSKHDGRVKVETFFQHFSKAGINARNAYAAYAEEIRTASPPSQVQQKSTPTRPETRPIEAIEAAEDIPEPGLPLYRLDGRYHWASGRTDEPISNFTIRPLFLLLDLHEPKRIWELTNNRDEKTLICFPSKYLAKPAEFTALVEGKGNFVPSWTAKQFSALKEYLFPYERQAEEVTILGHQPDTGHYAFAGGIYAQGAYHAANEFGVVQVGERLFYLPAFSRVNENAEREYHNERKFVFMPGRADFRTWSEQFCLVFGDNAAVGICFAVAALFRDIIFQHVNAFPLLFLFGPKGTGKTTYRLALKRLFGNYGPNDTIGLGSQSSAKGFARKLAQIRNGLEAFEEYKNRINPALIEMLKNIYDGIGYERAQTSNDNRTHATPVHSAIIFGGQEIPSKENALFSRVIMLTFNRTGDYTPDETSNFQRLEDLFEDGLGNVLLEVIQHRDKFAAGFEAAYREVYGHFRKDPLTQHLDQRSLTNAACILAPLRFLKDLLHFPFDYKTAYRIFRDLLTSQQDQMNKSNEVSQFWQVFSYLAEGGQLGRNSAYLVKDEYIFIHLDTIYPKYYEQASKANLTALDQPTLESYLAMHPGFKRPQERGRLTHRVRMDSGRQKRCLAFSLQFLELDFFETTGHKDEEF